MNKYFEIYSKRINRINIVILLFAFMILISLFSIQLRNKPQLEKIINSHGYKTKKLYGIRGRILDANNRELANSVDKYTFWVNTNEKFNFNKISNFFANSFNKDKSFYTKKLNKKANYIVLEKDIRDKNASKILDNINDLEKHGLRYSKRKSRFYKYNNIASQTIGYVDEKGNGIIGIEKNFNELLNGDTIEVELIKGPKGGYFNQDFLSNYKIHGYDIQLTIDIEIQKIIQEELNKMLIKSFAKSANAILMNPYNGDIISMVSLPDFNPNNYNNYKIETFKNRVISDTYEPGSTLKIIPMALALETNKASLLDSFYCENGTYILKNNKKLHDHEPHAYLSLEEIMAYSSNIGFAKLSEILNKKDLYKYLKYFGLGTKTFIPLNNEEIGKIRELSNWSSTSINYISIGQEISITNLQLALAYSVIANGGILVKPNIIKNIIKNNEIKIINNEIVIRRVLSNETTVKIMTSLEKVIKFGTAKEIGLDGYQITGKTGTAQKYIGGNYLNYISTFVSIFPQNNPKYVLVITIDEPKYGYHWASKSAVPVSQEIIKRMIISDKNLHNTLLINNHYNQDNKNKILLSNYSIEKENYKLEKFPNLKGKTFKEALNIANKYKVILDPGNNGIYGKVIFQSIKEGESIKQNQICEIKMKIL